MTLKELKKALKDEKKITFGTKQVIAKLKTQKLEFVIISSNCPQRVKDNAINYAKLTDTKVSVVEETSEALGIICKKPFSINLLCF